MKKTYFVWAEFTKNCSQNERYLALNDKIRLNNFIQLYTLVNTVRVLIARPMIVTSCYRDYSHNKVVGGSSTSQHIDFGAMDFTCSDIRYIWNLIKSHCEQGDIVVGQCILYPKKNFIHISISTDKHTNEFFEK